MRFIKALLSLFLLIFLTLMYSCAGNPMPQGELLSKPDEAPMSENRAILERELAQSECKDERMDDLVAIPRVLIHK
jgi:hypothetical protein